jgi:hypothetical protein
MHDAELRLANEDPKVEPFPEASGAEGYIVHVSVEGPDSPELEAIINTHVEPLGIEALGRDMTFTLYGVRVGQEAETIAAVEAAIIELNEQRAQERERYERERPAIEAEKAAASAELDAVRKAFRAARRRSR